MRAIITYAERNPRVYLIGCLLLGTVLRLGMAHGDLGRFIDPLYPLIHH